MSINANPSLADHRLPRHDRVARKARQPGRPTRRSRFPDDERWSLPFTALFVVSTCGAFWGLVIWSFVG